MHFVRSLALVAVVAAVSVPSLALACKKAGASEGQAEAGGCHADKAESEMASCEGHAAEKQLATVGKVSVPELASLMEKKAKVTVLDANSEKTRASEGVIPGATLLSSAARFDPSKELPQAKDAKLVFYCASTKCTASHMAAKRATEAGYTDVAVLPDGIKGWKQAGKSTSSVPRS